MLRENIHNHEPESIITDSDIQVAQMFNTIINNTLLSCSAAARPAGPLPTTAIFLPVLLAGICGLIQPCSNA